MSVQYMMQGQIIIPGVTFVSLRNSGKMFVILHRYIIFKSIVAVLVKGIMDMHYLFSSPIFLGSIVRT